MKIVCFAWRFEKHIEDFLREQCALYYPTAVEAECNGILTADFNANEYRVDFSLKDTEDQQLTGITVGLPSEHKTM